MKLRTFALGSFAVLALAVTGRAQTAQELAGLWRRLPQGEAGEKLYRLTATPDGKLTGELLNPPEGLRCELSLAVENGKVTGAGTWVDGEHRSDPPAKWELTFKGAGKLEGRVEWIDFEDGKIYDRGWEDGHRFEKLGRVGLITDADGAEAPMGEPIQDAAALAGGWSGAGGAWVLSTSNQGAFLVALGHHDGAKVQLSVERGALRGKVESTGTEVELALNEGKLEGRAAWTEGTGEHATKGWAPLTLTRLPRLDAGASTAEEPGQGETTALDGVWRRDDGLYLRLQVDGARATGVLSDKAGATRCRVELAPQNGRWVGTANWDGVEVKWELAAQGAELSGRCEWADVHEQKVVARGWTWRTFKPLRRVS
jgi:hypothetical protein